MSAERTDAAAEYNRSTGNVEVTSLRRGIWRLSGSDSLEQVQRDGAKHGTKETAAQSQKQTFNEQLAQDAVSAGAQGEANADFSRAAGDAHHEQISDIGAGEQQ